MSECLFCKIVSGDIPGDRVLENDEVLAFRDISPKAPVHVLVIPKRHVESVEHATDADVELLGKLLLAARDVARAEGVHDSGYRVVTNRGETAGQSVFHLHFHVLGGRAMGWPPG